MLEILTAILPLALRIVGMFLDRSGEESEARRAFYNFIDSLENQRIVPSKLRASYRRQDAATDDMIKDIEEKEGVKK